MSEPFDPRVTPWHIDESEFYEIDSYRDQMAFLLRYTILAPSTHNTQPWSFRITETGVEFYADYTRRLMIVDPGDRELMMSIGAAIANFRIAAAHFGYETTAMYERGEEEAKPVAVIAVRETSLPDDRLQRLFSAIPQRRTNRHLFDAREIEPDALQAVCDLIDDYPTRCRSCCRTTSCAWPRWWRTPIASCWRDAPSAARRRNGSARIAATPTASAATRWPCRG
jgi:hypothetical protein